MIYATLKKLMYILCCIKVSKEINNVTFPSILAGDHETAGVLLRARGSSVFNVNKMKSMKKPNGQYKHL